MLITMGQKAKAQMLITMIAYFKVLKNMDNIYGYDRLGETVATFEEDDVFSRDSIRVLKRMEAYIKHQIITPATSIMDVSKKEEAQRELARSRMSSRVDEYMKKREENGGESDLEYFTGILGSGYGNIASIYNNRNKGVLDKIYDKFISIIMSMGLDEINDDDITEILKRCDNLHARISKELLSLDIAVKNIISSQHFMCNYAHMNTLVLMLSNIEMVAESVKANFKPERVPVVGAEYLDYAYKALHHTKAIKTQLMAFYDINRKYETGNLDVENMTFQEAISLSCRNAVIASFSIKLEDGITYDDVSAYVDEMDAMLIMENSKHETDSKYKPAFYRIAGELIANEHLLITGRLKSTLDRDGIDTPRMKCHRGDKVVHGKLTLKSYIKHQHALKNWIYDQFDLDWDSGIYGDKRNGLLLTISDKSKAQCVFNK